MISSGCAAGGAFVCSVPTHLCQWEKTKRLGDSRVLHFTIRLGTDELVASALFGAPLFSRSASLPGTGFPRDTNFFPGISNRKETELVSLVDIMGDLIRHSDAKRQP